MASRCLWWERSCVPWFWVRGLLLPVQGHRPTRRELPWGWLGMDVRGRNTPEVATGDLAEGGRVRRETSF